MAFFEWKKVLGGKIPFSISMKDDSPFVWPADYRLTLQRSNHGPYGSGYEQDD
jgi:hypothetical protein